MKFKVKISLTLILLLIICVLQACGPAPRKQTNSQVGQGSLNKTPVDNQAVMANNCDQGEGLEDVETLYALNMYKLALQKAADLLERSCSPKVDFQVYKMMGRIYDARKEPVNAAYFYLTAHEIGDPPEQETVWHLAVQSASCIDTEGIIRLSDTIEMMFQTGGDLLFGVGMAKYEKGEDKDSLALLQAYRSRYPRKASLLQTETIIQTIEDRTAFNRHRIGVLLPLSGVYAPIGNNILMAINLALNEYDRRHANAMFQLIVRDTQADPYRAIEAVRELHHYKVSGIIGPMLSANAAAGEAVKLEVPMIVLTQKEDIPGFIEAVAYDTSMMMMGILSQSEVKTREDIANNLKSSKTYSGITGKTSFDSFGEPVKEINLVQLTDKASL